MPPGKQPTDSAILADEDRNALTVEFLERVFMKSKYSYKAVALQGLVIAGWLLDWPRYR